MGRYFSRAVVALPLVLATGSIIAEEDVFKDAPGFYVELTGPEGETKSQVTTVKPKIVSSRKAGTYGPLKSSDTLWSISNRVRPNKSVSVYQTMTAIFNKNPHAFVNNDINRLVAGAVLAIPTEAEIRGINSQSAQSDFVAKSSQGKNTKPATKPAATPAPSVEAVKPAEVAKPAAKPVVVTPEPEVVAQATPAPEATTEQASETVAVIPEAAEKEINDLKTQLDDSNSQLMQVTESNQRLKNKIESLTQDISGLKTKLEEDAKVQAEIKAMLAQQMAEKEAQQAAAAEKEASLLNTIGSSWLYLLGVILFPVLLVVLIFTFWLRARTKQQLDEQEKEMAESTSALMEEENSEFDDLLASNVNEQETPDVEDDLSSEGLNNADLESADDLDLLQEVDLDGDTTDELDLESPTNDLFEDQPSNDVEEVTDFSFDPEPSTETEDTSALELDIEDELVTEEAAIEPEIDFSESIEAELNEPEVTAEPEVAIEPELAASPDADLAADWEKELSDAADDEISFESDLSLDNEVDLEKELGLEDEVDIEGLAGLDLEQPVSVEDAIAAMDAEAAPEQPAQAPQETDEELLSFDVADSLEPEVEEQTNELEFSLEDELQDPSADITSEPEAEISLSLEDDNALELETLEPAVAEPADETVLDFSNELSLEDELSLEPTEQKADEVSIDAELDLSDDLDLSEELALEPEASIEPELALEPELSLEPELVEPAVEATPEVVEPVVEQAVVEEPVIEQPAAEQAETATNTPSDNKILSELDLSNIEFEEADESIFDLEADEDTLIQDDEMIVELDEVEDLLAETSAPAQEQPKVAPQAPAEPMEFNTPEPAADDIAMDFDFSEPETQAAPEAPAVTPEPVVEAPASDTNELEWDFAEVESIDEVKNESADDVEAADLLASQLGEVAFNETAEVPLVDDVEDDFIDINKLLEDSDSPSGDDEPYQAASLDVGLDEFPEILPESDGIDVDDDEGGIGQKLDLARAYLEIDDKEGAKNILEEIQGLGSVEQISEVEKLLDRLS